MHLSRFFTRKVRQDTRDSSESDEKPPAREVPIAVERLHGMLQADVERSREIVRSGALGTAPATVAFGEPPDKGRDSSSATGLQTGYERRGERASHST